MIFDLLVDSSSELAFYHVELVDGQIFYKAALISQDLDIDINFLVVCPEFKAVVRVPKIFHDYRSGLYWPDEPTALDVQGLVVYGSYKDFLKENLKREGSKGGQRMEREVGGE